MKLKKILSVLLASVMLAGCGAGESSSGAASYTSSDASSAVTDVSTPGEVSAADTSPAEDSSSAADESPESRADSAPEVQTSDITPAMWEVTSDNGGRLVMMGSMHALKEECYPLPERISGALESADALAVECDIIEGSADPGLMTQEVQKMYYPLDETISDHISAEVLESVRGFAKAIGFDLSLYERCKPWVWLTLIEMQVINKLGLSSDLGIDKKLLEEAKETGKEIIELESTSFQMDLLTSYSDEICELLMQPYTPDTVDEFCDDYADTYEAWKNGDFEFFQQNYSRAGQLKALEDAGIGPDSEEYRLMSDYIDSMQTDRNSGMAEKAARLLEEGRSVFLVVGEAHFCGEEGILSLLEARGYKVKQI